MFYENQFKAKLTDSHAAVEQIGSDSVVAVGQAVWQPPALMEALASRAEAGNVDNVKLYYMHADEAHAPIKSERHVGPRQPLGRREWPGMLHRRAPDSRSLGRP
jgi:acyl-CoA hydrolase